MAIFHYSIEQPEEGETFDVLYWRAVEAVDFETAAIAAAHDYFGEELFEPFVMLVRSSTLSVREVKIRARVAYTAERV